MFAIIKTGGKQYNVAVDNVIKVEKLMGASGDSVEFTDVLMMGRGDSVKVGAPFVTHAKVCGTILDQIRDDKVIIFKKTRRHNYRRKNGHRQYLTVIRITDILAEGEKPKAKVAPVKAKEETKKVEKVAAPKTAPKSAEKKASSKIETKTPVKKAAVKDEAKVSPKKAAPNAKKPSKK